MNITLPVFIPARRTWGLCKLPFADRLNSGGLQDWGLATPIAVRSNSGHRHRSFVLSIIKATAWNCLHVRNKTIGIEASLLKAAAGEGVLQPEVSKSCLGHFSTVIQIFMILSVRLEAILHCLLPFPSHSSLKY